jgi:hypothetical protein
MQDASIQRDQRMRVFASSISSLICCMHASIKLNSSGHTGQVAWQEQVSTRFTLMSLSSLVSEKTLLAPKKAAHREYIMIIIILLCCCGLGTTFTY